MDRNHCPKKTADLSECSQCSKLYGCISCWPSQHGNFYVYWVIGEMHFELHVISELHYTVEMTRSGHKATTLCVDECPLSPTLWCLVLIKQQISDFSENWDFWMASTGWRALIWLLIISISFISCWGNVFLSKWMPASDLEAVACVSKPLFACFTCTQWVFASWI